MKKLGLAIMLSLVVMFSVISVLAIDTADSVSKLIDEIQTVEYPKSNDAIIKAENAFKKLTEEDKGKVLNSAILISARKDFDSKKVEAEKVEADKAEAERVKVERAKNKNKVADEKSQPNLLEGLINTIFGLFNWFFVHGFSIVIVILLSAIIYLLVIQNKENLNYHSNLEKEFDNLVEKISSNHSIMYRDVSTLSNDLKKVKTNLDEISFTNGNGSTRQNMSQVNTPRPTPTQVEKPKTNLEKFNEAMISGADLSMIGFVPIDLSSENNLIEVKKLDFGNAKFYAASSVGPNNDFEVYPSKNIAMAQMSSLFSPWFEINKIGSQNVILVSPCKIRKNTVSGKYELINKGQVTT